MQARPLSSYRNAGRSRKRGGLRELVSMKLALVFLMLLTAVVLAEPAGFEFEPGKSMGPVTLGDTLDDCKMALAGWTYSISDEYVIGPYYIYPKEEEGVLVQFILGFTPSGRLRDIEIHDPSIALDGHPEVHLGCTRDAVVSALGPANQDLDTYLEYEDLGIRFMFEDGEPPRADDPHKVPKFGKGQCETIQCFVPGAK